MKYRTPYCPRLPWDSTNAASEQPTCRGPHHRRQSHPPDRSHRRVLPRVVAAAIVAVLLAVVAFVKMPSTDVTGGGGNLHMH